MDFNGYFAECLAKNGLTELSESHAGAFEEYYRLLVQWNEKMNLTAITQPQEVAQKHFADSLMLLKHCQIKKNSAIIDVGTGAGFPGIPLKIVRGDLQLTLLDSLNKRLLFLQQVLQSLGLDAVTVHGRAEDCAADVQYREKFDVATSRAVARLNVLCEYCLPFVKVGGYFAAMKGGDAAQELADSKNAVSVLGGRVVDVHSFTLYGCDERKEQENGRTIIVIEKVGNTALKYPRAGGKIKAKPL